MFKESDIVLSAKHIVKQFPASGGRTLTACNDVNLNVYKGKTLGIVGESGCGKSTFVRMVISLDKPTSGEILYHGKNLSDLSKKETWLNRQNMQMVFQDPLASFDPKMKIVDILTEPLINFGKLKRSEKEAKAREKKHMTFYEAAKLAREAQPKEMWLTHYSPSLTRPEEFIDKVREIFPRTIAAKDGRTVELEFDDNE